MASSMADSQATVSSCSRAAQFPKLPPSPYQVHGSQYGSYSTTAPSSEGEVSGAQCLLEKDLPDSW